MKLIMLVVLGAMPSLIFARNLVPNGSFELGTDGYGLQKTLRFDRNPNMEFIPLETFRDSAADGGQALRLRNPYAERFKLHSRQFPLKSNTGYTFRFRAKSTAEGQKLFFVPYSVRNNWHGWHFSPTLKNEWTEYEYKFKTGPKDGAPFQYHIQVRNVSDRNIPASDICIDKLELFESESVPSKSVELALAVKEPLFVSDGKTSIPLTLKAGNFTGGPWSGTVAVTAREEFFPGLGDSRTLDLKLAPGEIQEIPVKLSTGYGAFQVTASADGIGHSIPTAFAVIGKYERGKLDFDRDFCVGINDGPDIIQNQTEPHFGIIARNAAPEKKFEYLAQMGCRMIREHDGGYESTAWSILEPQKGKWNFAHMDYTLNLFRKYGFEPLSCIGRINFLRPNEQEKRWRSKGWPDWLEPLCHPVTHKSYNWNGVRGRVFLPPIELWREYVRKIATHAKGRIRYYEVFNEANGVMSAEDYFPFQKALYEEVKKVDPSAKVLGLCVTSDFGVSGDRFTLDVMKLGGGRCMDIAAFHPYRGRELNSINPADRYIANFRKCLGPGYEKSMPVWNTELYYLFDTTDSSAMQSLCSPAHVAARFLTDLGENVGQSVSIHGGRLWSRRLLFPEGAGSSDSWVNLVPNGNFVVYNALARHFEAAEPVAKHRLPNGTVTYLYRKQGRLVAAVWNWQKKTGVNGDFSGLRVLDLYGNPLKSGILPLTGAPYYVFPGALDETEFRRKLANLPVVLKNPVSATPLVRILNGGGSYSLLAMLHNDSPEEQTAVVGFQGNRLTAERSIRATIPAGHSAGIQLPLRKTETESASVLRIYTGSGLLDVPVKTEENPQIPVGKEISMGQNGFQALWTLKRAGNNLVFEAKIRDASNSGADAAGRQPWQQDCVELFVDTAPDELNASHPHAYTPNTFRIFVMPRLAPGKQLTAWLNDNGPVKRSGLNCTVVPEADGYRVTVVVPLEKIGRRIGFDVKVDDALPGKRTHRELHWTGEKENHRNRTTFGIIEL